MRGEKFYAKEKKTHKMTRDGLVEQNALSGEQRRVSGRMADFSLDKKESRQRKTASTPRSAKKRQSKRDHVGNLQEEILTPYEKLEQESMEETVLQEEKVQEELFLNSSRKSQSTAKKQAWDRKVSHAFLSPKDKQPQKKSRTLQFDRQEQTQEERADAHEKTSQSKTTSSRQQKADKAQQQAKKTAEKLDDAKENLPTRTRLLFEREFDAEKGKSKHKVKFENEVKPENAKSPLKDAVKTVISTPTAALWYKGHQKIHQVEQDNVGVESAHKMEERAERLGWMTYKHHRYQKKHQPYRDVRKLEYQAEKANINAAYQRTLLEHPELERKSLAKWIQKQQIKRQYAKAARQVENTAQTVRTTKEVFVQIVRAIAHFCGAHKVVLGIVVVGCVLFIMFASLLGSCGAFFSGAGTSTFAASYTADDMDINRGDLYYTEKETDLQYEINHIEQLHPGFDEYRYDIKGEIGHDAYELMAYLSAMYDFFTFDEIKPILDELFEKQYDFQLIEEKEIRTDSDGNEYEWHILNVILTVTPMEEITIPQMLAADKKYKYDVYQQTYGNRQNYGNPFSFCWLSYVSSPYGYRLNPFTGEKQLHKGIDIAVAAGTPIQAVHDGRVISAGNAGAYGLCVVIEDERGYQSRYAHCSALSVSTNQEVKKGEVIAAVGSTGNSTGPHLHLEVIYQGQTLNPFYFVDNGYEAKEEKGL